MPTPRVSYFPVTSGFLLGTWLNMDPDTFWDCVAGSSVGSNNTVSACALGWNIYTSHWILHFIPIIVGKSWLYIPLYILGTSPLFAQPYLHFWGTARQRAAELALATDPCLGDQGSSAAGFLRQPTVEANFLARKHEVCNNNTTTTNNNNNNMTIETVLPTRLKIAL